MNEWRRKKTGGKVDKVQGDRMTPEERGLAERYHGLIFTFLRENKLNNNDYYGIAAIGYCKAVMRYCRNENLKKYSLTTIAWYGMRREVGNEREKRQRIKRNAPLVSLDAAQNGDESLSLHGCIGKMDIHIEEITESEIKQEIISRLDMVQRQQLECVLQGYSIKESAEILKIPKSKAYKIQKAIKQATYEIMKMTDWEVKERA